MLSIHAEARLLQVRKSMQGGMLSAVSIYKYTTEFFEIFFLIFKKLNASSQNYLKENFQKKLLFCHFWIFLQNSSINFL